MTDHFIRFRRGTRCLDFVLGEEYLCENGDKKYICKFIQVTRKGFNLLDVNTNRCIMRRHLYDREFQPKKHIPKARRNFSVRVWEWWQISKIEKEKAL
jgi:hypothetical protein